MKSQHSRFTLLRYLFINPGLIILYIFVAPINAIVEVGLAYMMSMAVEFAQSGSIDEFKRYAIIFIFYILISFATGYFRKYIRLKILSSTMQSLKNDLNSHIISMPLNDFRKHNTGKYLNELTTNADMIRESYYTSLLNLYTEILKFIIAFIAIFWLSIPLGILVIVLAFAQLIVPYIFTKRISASGKAFSISQANYILSVKEYFASFITNRIFNIEDNVKERHDRLCKTSEDARAHSKLINSLSYEVSFVIGNIMYLGIYLLGAILVIREQLLLPAIIAASQLMVYIASPLTNISGSIAEMKSTREVIHGMNDLLSTTPVSRGSVRKDSFCRDIVLNDISFSYEGKGILENLSYTFEKGKKYIITGESGSGKSTLLSLISRLMPVDSGKITIDDVDIEEILTADYTSLMTFISQDPYLFDETLAENIRLFYEADDNAVMDALTRAGLSEYLKSASNGLNTKIGENAGEISGGERQRIAIARALLRNSHILIMDESTSNLDPTIAEDIERLIFTLEDITVLFVTHHVNPNIELLADEHLHLEGGRFLN